MVSIRLDALAMPFDYSYSHNLDDYLGQNGFATSANLLKVIILQFLHQLLQLDSYLPVTFSCFGGLASSQYFLEETRHKGNNFYVVSMLEPIMRSWMPISVRGAQGNSTGSIVEGRLPQKLFIRVVVDIIFKLLACMCIMVPALNRLFKNNGENALEKQHRQELVNQSTGLEAIRVKANDCFESKSNGIDYHLSHGNST
ncbi:hypothetical protein ACH5RR_020395 [Cinchona calisaya]|uniref:Uncharacterized protein n=1 Tax=Cinchona calisaya TaxID=153742 RepID=A0ABD2ZEB9_9GENT